MIAYILLYFGFYVFLCLGVRFIQRWSDGSRKLPPLEMPTEPPNPYEFAALRAGRHEIVRLFLFELIATGLIALTTDEKGKVTKQSQLRRTKKAPGEVSDLSPEGQTFFSWFTVEQAPRAVFSTSPLQSLAEQWAKKFHKRFAEQHLVPTERERNIALLVLLWATILFFGAGVSLIAWSLIGQKAIPVAFITGFGMFIGLIGLWDDCLPRKLSHRGTQYVKAVQEHFRPTLSPQVNDVKTTDALLAVGIMGVPILACTIFSDFWKLFSTGTVSLGGCGGGCGYGCGGGCSGCGGGCGD